MIEWVFLLTFSIAGFNDYKSEIFETKEQCFERMVEYFESDYIPDNIISASCSGRVKI